MKEGELCNIYMYIYIVPFIFGPNLILMSGQLVPVVGEIVVVRLTSRP